ncbi:MAG TPA: N-6 DNA methylase, partial [Nitrolancea sp.]|nr:N-6 DNA methylase [Nitrolancea sp.]
MLASQRDVDALKYAWLFFGAQAHLPGDDGRPFLRVALDESRAYAAGIEDDLRDRAYGAISAACQALADALAAERGIPATLLSHEDLRAVYGDALALLYQLLFILYAESRELLPVEDERYRRELSLRTLIERLPGRQDVRGDQHGQREQPAAAPREIWARLRRLFRALDDDTRPEYVPAFKGRLFDRDAHPLLRDLTPADGPLASMLALLGRTRDGRLIDYADLTVRQLGSIYEGLLEHQAIAVAEEDLALVKGAKDKVLLIVPLTDAAGRRVLERYPAGTVYLSNDKGERHAAGTYYTPEPVVRYLVDETLGPLVAGKRAEEILRLKVLDPAMGSGHFLVAAVDYLARAALAAEAEAARGGVGASGGRPTATDGRPTATDGRPTATDGRPTAETADREALDSGVMALKRRIAEQCIYGVDLNESAVELAKLSLWLATAARELPLTFLDAHLRAGNSLVGLAPGELDHAAEPPAPGAKRRGAKTKAAAGTKASGRATGAVAASAASGQSTVGASGGRPAQPAQADLWDESGFTQDMFRLVGGRQVIDLMDSRTAEDVRAKTHVLETLDPLAAPYRRLADLVVSRRFGNQMATEVFAAAAQTLLERGGVRLPEATLAPALAAARRIAERQHVFHWELEFPEVFRDGLGRTRGDAAGFDALLGNPPYVSVNTLRAADPEAWAYFPQVYFTTAQGKYDLYAAFVERGLALLNAHGRLAYILPNKWLTTDAGVGLRGLLAERRAAHAVVDFGAYPVFPGVSNYTCLLFARREPAERISVAQRTAPQGEIALPPRAESGMWASGEVEAGGLGAGVWHLAVGGAQAILDRMRDWPTLGAQATVFVGTCTNANPVFILREQGRKEGIVTSWSAALGRAVRLEAELLRPVLQGRDIAPYACDDGGNRLLFPYRVREGGANLLPADELAQRYPLAWAYLNEPTVRAALEGRENGRFMGKANWYGFGYPRNMHLLGE